MRFLLPLLVLGTVHAAAFSGSKPVRMSRRSTSAYNVPLYPNQPSGTRFNVEVTVGNGTYIVEIDTGSADLWLLGPDWECFDDATGALQPQEACTSGNQTYNSPTFEVIPDEYYASELGGGVQSGLLGRDTVTVGGATVKRQTLGVVNKTSNPGDGVYTGLLGLSYPSYTSGHNGSIAGVSNDTYPFNLTNYNNFFTSLYLQGSVEPYFSVAMDRDPFNASAPAPGGYLTFGGLPPIPHSSNFSEVPVEISPVSLNYTDNKPQRSWWAINVDSLVYGRSQGPLTTNSSSFLTIVDTGNYFNFLHADDVLRINSLFEPPAVRVPDSVPLVYTVDCNATAPKFGVTLGGQTFFHDGADMIIDTGSGQCVSALVEFPSEGFEGITQGAILGDAFLKNVVAVFDAGKNTMRFAARELSASNSTTSSTAGPARSTATGTTTASPTPTSGAAYNMPSLMTRTLIGGIVALFVALI